jgi:hypothetical protein
MAMSRKDFRRWTEDQTLKGKRERWRRKVFGSCIVCRKYSQVYPVSCNFCHFTDGTSEPGMWPCSVQVYLSIWLSGILYCEWEQVILLKYLWANFWTPSIIWS